MDIRSATFPIPIDQNDSSQTSSSPSRSWDSSLSESNSSLSSSSSNRSSPNITPRNNKNSPRKFSQISPRQVMNAISNKLVKSSHEESESSPLNTPVESEASSPPKPNPGKKKKSTSFIHQLPFMSKEKPAIIDVRLEQMHAKFESLAKEEEQKRLSKEKNDCKLAICDIFFKSDQTVYQLLQDYLIDSTASINLNHFINHAVNAGKDIRKIELDVDTTLIRFYQEHSLSTEELQKFEDLLCHLMRNQASSVSVCTYLCYFPEKISSFSNHLHQLYPNYKDWLQMLGHAESFENQDIEKNPFIANLVTSELMSYFEVQFSKKFNDIFGKAEQSYSETVSNFYNNFKFTKEERHFLRRLNRVIAKHHSDSAVGISYGNMHIQRVFFLNLLCPMLIKKECWVLAAIFRKLTLQEKFEGELSFFNPLLKEVEDEAHKYFMQARLINSDLFNLYSEKVEKVFDGI